MSVTDVGVVFSFYATVYCVLTPFFGWILKKTVRKHHNYLLSLFISCKRSVILVIDLERKCIENLARNCASYRKP